MKEYTIYYATNRNHIGDDRWHPESYGKDFSADGRENLRFGKVTVSADETDMDRFLEEKVNGMGAGNGEKLAGYLSGRAKTAKIEAFKENLDPKIPDEKQDITQFGSHRFFKELKEEMMKSTDVLVFVHGFGVSWYDAVGSALSLYNMLNRVGDQGQKVMIALFTWPSDGSLFPYRAYKADRADARDSGYAIGRGILKLRDFLIRLREEVKESKTKLCEQDIHLLCHSMGNYALQNALQRIQEFTPGPVLPRIFEHIFLYSADVDDSVLEEEQPMGRLNEITRNISIYYNRQDKALLISDLTKTNPERLGTNGAARPFKLHNKVHQIDCTPVVPGIVEHSYYLSGTVNGDIKRSIDGLPQDSNERDRETTGELPNVWRMKRVG